MLFINIKTDELKKRGLLRKNVTIK